MRLRIKNDNGIERLYIEKSIRISDKKVTTQNVEKLGRVDVLMASMELSREQVIAWAKKKVDDLNGSSAPILLSLSPFKINPPRRTQVFSCRISVPSGYLLLHEDEKHLQEHCKASQI